MGICPIMRSIISYPPFSPSLLEGIGHFSWQSIVEAHRSPAVTSQNHMQGVMGSFSCGTSKCDKSDARARAGWIVK